MRRALTAVVAATALLATIYVVDAWVDHASADIVLSKVETSGTAQYDPGTWKDTTFVLVIGSDERAGLEGARGDALHVIGLNAAAKKATVLNIPRDTWVDIPGYGEGRVNEAYRYGGAQLQAETVRRLTGAPIQYVLTTTFDGFVAMIDSLGGLEVDVPYLMDDPNSGAAFNPGPVVMTGERALAFARNRHIPDGDINRTANQGQLIIHGLAKLQQEGTSASDVLRYVDVLFRNVRTEGIDSDDLFRLGRAALTVSPADVRNMTIPARVGMRGSMSVVFADEPRASAVFRDFADDAVLQAS